MFANLKLLNLNVLVRSFIVTKTANFKKIVTIRVKLLNILKLVHMPCVISFSTLLPTSSFSVSLFVSSLFGIFMNKNTSSYTLTMITS